MCPQPPSWQAVALGLLILNSSQPHLLPSPRSTASREGRTRKVQVAPGSARLSRPAAADSGGPARDCAPAGRAPRSPLRGRCRPPPSPARGGAAPDSGLSSQGNLLRAARAPSCPSHRGPGSAAARRGVPGAARATLGRSHPASSKGRAAPGPARPSDWKGERAAREPGAGTRPPRACDRTWAGTARLRGPSTAGARGVPGERGGPSGRLGGAPGPGSPGNAGGRGTRIPHGRNRANPCLTFPGLGKGSPTPPVPRHPATGWGALGEGFVYGS